MEEGAFTRLGVLMACSPRACSRLQRPRRAHGETGATERGETRGRRAFCESGSKETIEHPTYENNDQDDLSFARAFGGECDSIVRDEMGGFYHSEIHATRTRIHICAGSSGMRQTGHSFI